jgi:hypothetical protein
MLGSRSNAASEHREHMLSVHASDDGRVERHGDEAHGRPDHDVVERDLALP